MHDSEAIRVLAQIYPRDSTPADRRSQLRRDVDKNRELILQMHAHGCSRGEIVRQLHSEGVRRADGSPLTFSQLSSLITRCRILHGEPDPAAPDGPSDAQDDDEPELKTVAEDKE